MGGGEVTRAEWNLVRATLEGQNALWHQCRIEGRVCDTCLVDTNRMMEKFKITKEER